MTVKINAINFSYYAFHPNSSKLSKKDQRIAIIATTSMGVLTFGLGYFICATILALKNIKKLKHSKIDSVSTHRLKGEKRGQLYVIKEENDSIISKHTSDQYQTIHGIKFKVIDSTNQAFLNTFGDRVVEDKDHVRYLKGNRNRIYKAKKIDSFSKPEELKISKLAGDLGIAPKIYNACIFQDKVIMEMDCVGKALRNLQSEEIKIAGISIKPGDFDTCDKYRVKAIETIYKDETEYSISVLKAVKELIAHNIAWLDSNDGNIIPGKPLYLIDFESAAVKKNPREALKVCFRYHRKYLVHLFKKENPNHEDQELKKWYCKTLGVNNKQMSRKLNISKKD